MYVCARASRVEVGGLDAMVALSVVFCAPFTLPLAAGAFGGFLSWGGGIAFLAALLAHAAIAMSCRYRLVVDGHGSVLWRACLGIPWSRRPYGRRPSVSTMSGWDWDELVIQPEHPRDANDHLLVMETLPGGWTEADCEASANLADREIARVTATAEPISTTPYRSPPPLTRARSGSR
jgi:hypothetical protein